MLAKQDTNSKEQGPLQPGEEAGLGPGDPREDQLPRAGWPAPGPGGQRGCNMVHGRLLLPAVCMEPNPRPNDIRKTSRVPSSSRQAENLLPGVGARGQWAQGESQHVG